MLSNKMQAQQLGRAAPAARGRSLGGILCSASAGGQRAGRGSSSSSTCPPPAASQHVDRRALLAGATVAVPLLLQPQRAEAAAGMSYMEVENLSSFQKSDQRNAFKARVEAVLKEGLEGADAPACVRLALHDAGTFANKSGGFDGSIVLNDQELSRPENKGLKATVAKLTQLKAKIDEAGKDGSGPISWADMIYLSGKCSVQRRWYESKVSSPKIGKAGGEKIARQFPNPWSVELGRVDGTEPGPNSVPAQDASVQEIREWLLKLGAKPDAGSGPFTPKPPFWEKPGFLLWTAAAADPEAEAERFAAAEPKVFGSIKTGYDRSKLTVTRTDFEVDFAAAYNKLCGLGATFKQDAYLFRIPVQSII